MSEDKVENLKSALPSLSRSEFPVVPEKTDVLMGVVQLEPRPWILL